MGKMRRDVAARRANRQGVELWPRTCRARTECVQREGRFASSEKGRQNVPHGKIRTMEEVTVSSKGLGGILKMHHT